MAQSTAATPMTLSDIQGHSSTERLFKCHTAV